MPLSLRARRQQGLFWVGVSCGKAQLGAVGSCRVLRCSLGASVRLACRRGRRCSPGQALGCGQPGGGGRCPSSTGPRVLCVPLQCQGGEWGARPVLLNHSTAQERHRPEEGGGAGPTLPTTGLGLGLRLSTRVDRQTARSRDSSWKSRLRTPTFSADWVLGTGGGHANLYPWFRRRGYTWFSDHLRAAWLVSRSALDSVRVGRLKGALGWTRASCRTATWVSSHGALP